MSWVQGRSHHQQTPLYYVRFTPQARDHIYLLLRRTSDGDTCRKAQRRRVNVLRFTHKCASGRTVCLGCEFTTLCYRTQMLSLSVLLRRGNFGRLARCIPADTGPLAKRRGNERVRDPMPRGIRQCSQLFVWFSPVHLVIGSSERDHHVLMLSCVTDSFMKAIRTLEMVTIPYFRRPLISHVQQAPKFGTGKAAIRVDFIFADVMKQEGWIAEASLLFVHTNFSAATMRELRKKAGNMKVNHPVDIPASNQQRVTFLQRRACRDPLQSRNGQRCLYLCMFPAHTSTL